ncbi:MAG: hypothetical protein K0R99_938 [Microbacterium sp.]|jgi:hypothetical protein|uniref:hypothetical protein n=1 Tax=Microbacterium sp. TaxID=51671 RepID=UPI00262B7D20|nr:hypothetical protein [Microbacterium sp.]MDF2559492.1 hypothetical protein [Microbacterium sp.]
MTIESFMKRESVEKMDTWKPVEEALADAAGVAWDGCHKIYVLADEADVEHCRGLGYGDRESVLISRKDQPSIDLGACVRYWFEESCSLRFVQACGMVGDQSEFTDLIAQFESAA